MASPWILHGLIQHENLEEVYEAAKQTHSDRDPQGPKEHATVHLFEDIFNIVLFPESTFKINSQQPPQVKERGNDKACDIAIRHVQDCKWDILCFAEAKRANKTHEAEIRELEEQVEGYCKAFLKDNEQRDMVYACTLVGVLAKCWTYEKQDEKLKARWGTDDKGVLKDYKDIGEDRHRADLEEFFEAMKQNPTQVPPLSLRAQKQRAIERRNERVEKRAKKRDGSANR